MVTASVKIQFLTITKAFCYNGSMAKFSHKLHLAVLFVSLSSSSGAYLWAKKIQKNEELSREVQKIDAISAQFNSAPKDKNRVEGLIASFEKFAGRTMTTEERKFLSLEFASVAELPRFEVNKNAIYVYQLAGGKKNILLDIEVVDAKKYLFKYKGNTFQMSPNKPLQENIQFILHKLQASDKAA